MSTDLSGEQGLGRKWLESQDQATQSLVEEEAIEEYQEWVLLALRRLPPALMGRGQVGKHHTKYFALSKGVLPKKSLW